MVGIIHLAKIMKEKKMNNFYIFLLIGLIKLSPAIAENQDYLKIIKKTKNGYYSIFFSETKSNFSCLFEKQNLKIKDEYNKDADLKIGTYLVGTLECKSPLNDGNTSCGFFAENPEDGREYVVLSKYINEIHIWEYCSSNVGKANFQNYSK